MINDADESEWERKAVYHLNSAGYTHIKNTALAERDWWGVISFATTNRYWECFDILKSLMRDAEYAKTAREIWVATNGLPPKEARCRLLQHGRNITQETWMMEDDASVFRGLPDVVTVYRGCTRGDNERGWSWSLTRGTAEHFAFGLCESEDRDSRIVVTGSVPKCDIIALFSGEAWEEQEVVVPGDLVTITQRTTIGNPPTG